MIAIWLTTKFFQKQRLRWLLFLGIITAIGFFFSVEMGVFTSLTTITTLVIFRKREFLKNELLFFLTGIVIVSLPIFIYLLFTGGMPDYFKCLITLPVAFHSVFHFETLHPGIPHSLFQAIKYLTRPADPSFCYSLPIAIYLIAAFHTLKNYLKGDKGQKEAMFFCIMLYGLLMYIGSFRQIEGPQFQIALQPSVILLFVILENLFNSFKSGKP